jgi:predicted RNA-binding Zn-ribbon protein involved in translation (DUF1610 family)
MKRRLDSFCGIYCGACPQESCEGCKTDVVEDWCIDCDFKSCAGDRGLKFCSECNEYPCDRIADFNNDEWSHHSSVIANLDGIRDRGLKVWLAEQKERWACPHCGSGFTWYDEKCRSCGKRVFNCVSEEKRRKQPS